MPVAATFARLLDDAGTAPPDALDGLVGSRVVVDVDLPDLRDLGADGLPVTLVVSGGAGQVAGPLGLCARRDLPLAGLHLTVRDPGEPAGAARRLVAVVDEARREGTLADDVPVRVALPPERPGHGWLAAADEVAAADLGLLLPTADGPPATTVVAWLDAAFAREIPVALATGAHPAVRSHGHGLLNLLLAVRSTLDGATAEDLAWLLDERDGEALVDLLAEHGDEAMTRTRRWLTSAASTDPLSVLAALRALGLAA